MQKVTQRVKQIATCNSLFINPPDFITWYAPSSFQSFEKVKLKKRFISY